MGFTLTRPKPALQLAFRLVVMSEPTVDTALHAALAYWTTRRDRHELADQSLIRFTEICTRFGRFVAAHDVVFLHDVTPQLVSKFVTAKWRTKTGGVASPAAATQYLRLITVRAFFRTVIRLSLAVHDPTISLATGGRGDRLYRPIDAIEAEEIRFFSEHGTPTRHAVTVALLLAGGRTNEVGWITAADIDPDAGTVTVDGRGKFDSRVLPLDPWSVRVIRERTEFLTDLVSGSDPAAVVLCTGSTASDAHRQASVGMTVKHVLRRSGIDADPAVKPRSLTAYAAQQVFDGAGRIEDAARRVGSRSLDATATHIGYQWDQG